MRTTCLLSLLLCGVCRGVLFSSLSAVEGGSGLASEPSAVERPLVSVSESSKSAQITGKYRIISTDEPFFNASIPLDTFTFEKEVSPLKTSSFAFLSRVFLASMRFFASGSVMFPSMTGSKIITGCKLTFTRLIFNLLPLPG